jgi:hypothetical protein
MAIIEARPHEAPIKREDAVLAPFGIASCAIARFDGLANEIITPESTRRITKRTPFAYSNANRKGDAISIEYMIIFLLLTHLET